MASPIELKMRALVALAQRFASKLPSGEGHAAWRQIFSQVSSLTETAQALHTLRATRNPTETEGAHQKRVSLAAVRLSKETTATMNRIFKITGDGHADIAARIRAKVKLQPDSYASEVRAVYRGLSRTEQIKMLNELVEQNRGPELAALIKAPASLTGMSEKLRQRYESAFLARHAPAEASEDAALEEAFDDAMVSARTAGEIADAYAKPAKLAEITRAEGVSPTAPKTFDEKVSGT
jgi:hypothetical protein